MQQAELKFPEGAWRNLFNSAMDLLDEDQSQIHVIPPWSLGGGTVLMLHYQHRLSKDIDIFITDPQFLGYINPKLGEPAERLTAEYQEASHFMKLYLPEGEIDFVVTTPLTHNPFSSHEVLGRNIQLETSIEDCS